MDGSTDLSIWSRKSQKFIESFLPLIGSARTSPVCASSAANSEAVPWRIYSNSLSVF